MFNQSIRLGLFAAASAAFTGCGGPSPESPAERADAKREEWRRQRTNAEERFAEVAQRLSPAQQQRLREELRREFDEGDRNLEAATLR